jgi:hypothetical protein
VRTRWPEHTSKNRAAELGQDNRDRTTMTGQSCRDKTHPGHDNGTGQPGQVALNSNDRSSRTFQPGQDTEDKMVRISQQLEDSRDRRERTRALERKLDRAAGTGQLEQYSWDRTAWTGQPGKDIRDDSRGEETKPGKRGHDGQNMTASVCACTEYSNLKTQVRLQ